VLVSSFLIIETRIFGEKARIEELRKENSKMKISIVLGKLDQKLLSFHQLFANVNG